MKLHMNLKEDSYDIILERGILEHVHDYVNLSRKVMIISDDKVPMQYATTLISQCKEGYLFTVASGERSKSMETYKEILRSMLEHSFTRSDCVIALGGGVIGDLSGFVAASYMRGVDFINIPTTTLAQIDSSIGGKVAINLDEVKNIVGAFYQPKIVLIDPDTLATLDKRQYVNGLIEAIKAGLIYDESLFELFEQGDIYEDIEEIIYKALQVKKAVVEEDEKEMGLRKILNFGHTIGHGIESYYHLDTYLHGECVAMGMLYFIKDEQLLYRVKQLYKKLKIKEQASFDVQDVFQLVCKDKKAENNTITVVEVEHIGHASLVTLEKSAIKELLKGSCL